MRHDLPVIVVCSNQRLLPTLAAKINDDQEQGRQRQEGQPSLEKEASKVRPQVKIRV